ncbi:MAG: hypothetical protein WCI38_05260 [Chthoniobacterales bacterium]
MNDLSGKQTGLIAAAIILAATAVLALAAMGELWLDEILSLQWAKEAASPLDLLRIYRHDNNHPINTLWLFLLGPERMALTYRTLAIFSGSLSLVLLYVTTAKLNPEGRLFTLALGAGSYAWILYGSEARGYAPALACSLGACWIIFRTDGKASAGWVILFWIVSITAVLAHATAVYPLAALGGWFVFCRMAERQPWRQVISATIAWFMLPAIATAAYYLYFLRPMMVAGGPIQSGWSIAADFFGYGFGLPVRGVWLLSGPLLGTVSLLAGLRWGNFAIPHIRIFFILVLAIFPFAGLLAAKDNFLCFRYFLVCLPFALMLIGALFARLAGSGIAGKILVGGVMLALLGTQVPRMAALVTLGRGSCRNVLARIASAPPGSQTVISEHELMLGLVMEFYRARDPKLGTIRYLPGWIQPSIVPEWVVTHSQEDPAPEPKKSLEVNGSSYLLNSTFHAAPVSGAHWFLYRKWSGM